MFVTSKACQRCQTSKTRCQVFSLETHLNSNGNFYYLYMTKMTSKTSTRRKPSQTINTSKINNTSKASTANSTSSTIQTCQTSTTSNTSKTMKTNADLMTSQSLAISCCFFGLMCFRNTRSRPSCWPAACESTSSKDGQSSSETLKSKKIKQNNNIL